MSTWTETFQAWQTQAATVRARANRIRTMRRERLDATCRAAGIGDYNGCSLHNG
jgi:hypothetical protein